MSADPRSGKDLSAVKVTLDGEALAERLEGSALSIDPGEHIFVFETEGQPPVTKQFVIRESEKDRREAITFGAGDVVSSPLQARIETPATAESRGLGTQKILATVADSGADGSGACPAALVLGIPSPPSPSRVAVRAPRSAWALVLLQLKGVW